MTELTPPTITPRVGTMRLRNKRYFDGENDYQRTSNMLKSLKTAADSYHLDMWKKRQVAIGLSQRPDLVLGVAAALQIDPQTGKLTPDAREAINGLCAQADDAAGNKSGSNKGTAVHTATERLDLGETVEQIGLPYPFDADLKAYAVLCRAMGLNSRPDMIERSVRNSITDTVGSFDRSSFCKLLVEMGLLEGDEMAIVDVKTEENPLLNLIHIAPQLANYANAEHIWVPEPTAENEWAGRYEPMPKVSRKVALVIHVRAGRAVPYLIDLTAGWEAAQAAAEQRERVKRSKIQLGETGCWAAAVPVQLPPATEVTAAAHERGPLGFSAPAGTAPLGQLDDVDKSAIAAAWAATDLASLAETYRIYTEVCGRPWGGRVAEAADARRRQIDCPQRSLHTPPTPPATAFTSSGRCACGWTPGVAP